MISNLIHTSDTAWLDRSYNYTWQSNNTNHAGVLLSKWTHLSFFASLVPPPSCSDWSSLMATITYPTRTTFAMIAASAPAYVELP